MTKSELRRMMRETKRALTTRDMTDAEQRVLASLAPILDELPAGSKVAAYASLPDELPTECICRYILESGHALFLPVVEGDEMTFRRCTHLGSMKRESRFGILQPDPDAEAATDDLAIILVPGIAFSEDGRRLGRGKGYYDKALALFRDARKIGIALDCQRRQDIPVDQHDVRMDHVVFG